MDYHPFVLPSSIRDSFYKRKRHKNEINKSINNDKLYYNKIYIFFSNLLMLVCNTRGY